MQSDMSWSFGNHLESSPPKEYESSDLGWLRNAWQSSEDIDMGSLLKLVELEMIHVQLSKLKVLENYQRKIKRKRRSRSPGDRMTPASLTEAERWLDGAASTKREVRGHSNLSSTSEECYGEGEEIFPAYVSCVDLSFGFDVLREPESFRGGAPVKVMTDNPTAEIPYVPDACFALHG